MLFFELLLKNITPVHILKNTVGMNRLKLLYPISIITTSMYRITPHTTRTFIHHNTYVKEGMRVINGYINRTFFTSMLWVRGVHGSEHLS